MARWKGSCDVTVLGPDRFNALTSGTPDVTLRSWHGWDHGAPGNLLQSALKDNVLQIGLASITKGWRLTVPFTMEWTVNKFLLFGKKKNCALIATYSLSCRQENNSHRLAQWAPRPYMITRRWSYFSFSSEIVSNFLASAKNGERDDDRELTEGVLFPRERLYQESVSLLFHSNTSGMHVVWSLLEDLQSLLMSSWWALSWG